MISGFASEHKPKRAPPMTNLRVPVLTYRCVSAKCQNTEPRLSPLKPHPLHFILCYIMGFAPPQTLNPNDRIGAI